MQKKEGMLLVLALCLLSTMPFIFATTTLNVPVTGYNYTAITFNCTTDVPNPLNISIYYNSTAGKTGAFLGKISNTSAAQKDFTSSISIEALSDTLTYNMTCYADNGTAQEYSVAVSKIGIDNTKPALSLSASTTSLDLNGLLKLTWSVSDATSGLASNSLTLTSPNSETCPTQTYTATSATEQTVDATALGCPGTYTATLTATDKAGNTDTTTQSITLNAGGSLGGMGTSAGSGVSVETGVISGPGGKAKLDSQTIAIIVIIILVVYFGLIKKK